MPGLGWPRDIGRLPCFTERMTDEPRYSERVDAALVMAADAFRHKSRKGSGVPYLSHLLQVATSVMESHGDEDQIIAALLHDYLEDIPGATTEELTERFGPRVCSLVEALSDSQTHPKPPWRERKERYLEHLRTTSDDVRLVSVCDKLHNASSILRDLDEVGEQVWERFSATREQTLWYYRAVTEALADGWSHPLLTRLQAVVEQIHAAVGVATE